MIYRRGKVRSRQLILSTNYTACCSIRRSVLSSEGKQLMDHAFSSTRNIYNSKKRESRSSDGKMEIPGRLLTLASSVITSYSNQVGRNNMNHHNNSIIKESIKQLEEKAASATIEDHLSHKSIPLLDETSSIGEFLSRPFSETYESSKPFHKLLIGEYKLNFTKETMDQSLDCASDTGSTAYSLIPNLSTLISAGHYKEAVELITTSYNQGVYLTPTEFEQILARISSNKPIAYLFMKLYSSKYELSLMSASSLEILLAITKNNYDYDLHLELYQTYLSKVSDPSPFALLRALIVLINSESISMAVQWFNQSVMMYKNLEPDVLHVYIKTLFRVTSNPSLCYNAYRLWLSKDLPVSIETDAMIYQLLRDNGSNEQFEYVDKLLEKRGRKGLKFEILVTDLDSVLKSAETLKLFYSSGDYQRWLDAFWGDELLTRALHDKLFNIHLKFDDLAKVKEILMMSDDNALFIRRLNRLIKSLVNNKRPDILVPFLIKLHKEVDLKIYDDYILKIWHSCVKKYPHLKQEITEKFIRFVKVKETNGLFLHLVPIFKQRNFDNNRYMSTRQFIIPQITGRPTVDYINSRLKMGIIPRQEEVVTAINLSETLEEVDQLIEIVNSYPKLLKPEDINLKSAIFWKQQLLCKPRPQVSDFLAFYEERSSPMTFYELLKLLKISVKCNEAETSYKVLSDLVTMKPPSESKAMRFVSLLLDFFLSQNKYKNVISVVESVRADKSLTMSPVMLNIMDSLKLQKQKDISLRQSVNLNSDPHEEFRRKLDHQVIQYLDETKVDLSDKIYDQKLTFLKNVDSWLLDLAAWVKHDVGR
ncbi:hypothetical protein CANARDRAFT_22197 [[Candida] arabinofermentans NRRL YB-2248]|uniref:Uncharacterized protein n=1 Tax=[Candida] arabinofermentans NRRL YB-2248 TaxID=983967 RepID=A0A1E4T3G1_9ASCO|nr:hypothetical protein CANARDRAFT_22197 [[Candida] arabinofermentans NRRL YB-2248]